MRSFSGKAHRQFVQARLVDVAGEAEKFRAGTFFGADRFVPIGAAIDDVRDVRQRLDIVDDGRASERALDRGERRTISRIRALAFERFEQAGFLSADVRAGAAMREDVEVEAGAQDIFAEIVVGVGLCDGGVDDSLLHRELAAQVGVCGMRTDGAARDHDSLDDAVRIEFELVAIREGAGLALVGVAAQVDRLLRVLRDEAPLDAGRKRRAAASAQIRVLDLVDNLLGLHLEQRLAQRLVAAVADVHVELAKVRDIQPASQYPFHVNPGAIVMRFRRDAFR